ncbi:glutathione S-transferase alpha I-like isoform X2 [Phascolarctos cinereus]|uniref:glutathione transferase n=1 Tax=Phascolarctos cinereus TaxID=38626 RepID=A0A6P5L1U2_PHACI|nr:glutathione S-transferase alpha I-like isoform X2 [Phascolarctos cinereus]
MAAKPILYYFNGRGRMESVRWLLAAAGVEFEEVFLETAEDLQNLIKDGKLMYEQVVPMVEIDGMKMVQSRAILRYIAAKYSLYGKDLKEQVLIDMYVEGMRDLYDIIILLPLALPEEQEKNLSFVNERATQRFFPVYEKEFKARISKLPRIQKFLQPGSPRKPLVDDASFEAVKKIFNLEKGLLFKYSSTLLANF